MLDGPRRKVACGPRQIRPAGVFHRANTDDSKLPQYVRAALATRYPGASAALKGLTHFLISE